MGARRGGLGLKFQKKASRPVLDTDQFLYWDDMLGKVLKLGTEFEINLPEADQGLKSNNLSPCIHAHKPCVTDCTNVETCLVERHPTLCLTRETGLFLGNAFACPAENNSDVAACGKCPSWLLNCRELNCAMYTPYCTICPSFLRKGDRAVENSDIRQDADSVRSEMKQLLQPSGDVARVGPFGALEVKKDGSLVNNGGIEVPTVGRRVYWNSFYRMCKNIIEPIAARGGYINERCGQHFHLLAGYFSGGGPGGGSISELEEPMPEIILANFHQLNRRYELAMFWLMSSGEHMETLTRWAKFRQPILKYSAMQSPMRKIQRELADNIPGGNRAPGKYASSSYYFCRFSERGDVETFHIENRIADGCLAPSVVAAWGMLIYALALKAVRLSQYGVMEVGNRDYLTKLEKIYPHFINGQEREYGNTRSADTAGIGTHIPWLQENARELVQLLKAELNKLGPSFDILMQLADRPLSIRRTQGDSWDDIERELNPTGCREEEAPQIIEREVAELVDLTGIVDCASLEEWVEEVAASLDQPSEAVTETVTQLIQSDKYRWSGGVGALITT